MSFIYFPYISLFVIFTMVVSIIQILSLKEGYIGESTRVASGTSSKLAPNNYWGESSSDTVVSLDTDSRQFLLYLSFCFLNGTSG